MHGGGSGGGGRTPTTVPPPFDPQEFARDSEFALRAAPASDMHATAEMPPAPPLNKRVLLSVPESELAWFDLSEGALALAARMDGTTTLNELLDSPDHGLEAVGQLHDAGLLKFED
jgi:hypothetical protein